MERKVQESFFKHIELDLLTFKVLGGIVFAVHCRRSMTLPLQPRQLVLNSSFQELTSFSRSQATQIGRRTWICIRQFTCVVEIYLRRTLFDIGDINALTGYKQISEIFVDSDGLRQNCGLHGVTRHWTRPFGLDECVFRIERQSVGRILNKLLQESRYVPIQGFQGTLGKVDCAIKLLQPFLATD